MAIDEFATLTTTAVPLPIDHVDTDQIVPARFLKATERKGFADHLFRDWRYAESGRPKGDFVLNNPNYRGKILLAGRNFGCGSSREHAAWALYDYGFRVVVSSFFADIFQNNALNIGLLPITLAESLVREITNRTLENPKTAYHVDLPAQTFAVVGTPLVAHFEINAYKKACLRNGFDDIDYLLNMQADILQYEEKKKTRWM